MFSPLLDPNQTRFALSVAPQHSFLAKMVSLALIMLSIGAVSATQVMHRPPNFKTQLKANAPFAGNNTVAPRIEITKRGIAKANLGYFVNW